MKKKGGKRGTEWKKWVVRSASIIGGEGAPLFLDAFFRFVVSPRPSSGKNKWECVKRRVSNFVTTWSWAPRLHRDRHGVGQQPSVSHTILVEDEGFFSFFLLFFSSGSSMTFT